MRPLAGAHPKLVAIYRGSTPMLCELPSAQAEAEAEAGAEAGAGAAKGQGDSLETQLRRMSLADCSGRQEGWHF